MTERKQSTKKNAIDLKDRTKKINIRAVDALIESGVDR